MKDQKTETTSPERSGHAPGPWMVTKSTVNPDESRKTTGMYSACIVEEGGAHTTIARLSANIKREKIDANARLIAAAPELLEALQNLCTEMGLSPDYSDAKSAMSNRQSAINAAFSAIAKAGGAR